MDPNDPHADDRPTSAQLTTTCCIAGGGPAGLMLGLLLARAGVDVAVLEKHDDFLRDFRGDTIHPSTLDLVDQLGLRTEFDAIPHTEVRTLDVVINGARATAADFGRLHHGNKRLVLMPQWDFLDLIAAAARRMPNFHLAMGTEARGLTQRNGVITGVSATTRTGILQVDADLTIAADGRASRLRDASGLKGRDFGAPIDVLWFRLPRPAVNPPDTIAFVGRQYTAITIPREGYYQAAMLIRKGSFGDVRAAGLESFRESVATAVPFLAEVTETLTNWDQIKLLSVQIDRLDRWHLPGFLAIGDAAHAMSPVFGVGVNYAIQDAVATANELVPHLRNGSVTERNLAAIQARREKPTARMQRLQRWMHDVIARPGGGADLPPERVLRALFPLVMPALRSVTSPLIGRGFRPERIDDDVLRPRS